MEIPKISVLTVGTKSNPILDSLLSNNNIHLSIICLNLLDYVLPPIVENSADQSHRYELRHALRAIAPDSYSISSSLKDLLEENNRLELDDLDLSITSHIDQIEQNSKSLDIAYISLLKETKQENISLFPLVTKIPNLLVFKNKKYAPLRFYHEREELLKSDPPSRDDEKRKNYPDKKLTIENIEKLEDLKIFEGAYKGFQNSDLILILPTDMISFGILMKAIEIEKQIKKLSSPIVLIWPFKADQKPTKVEQEIATAMKGDSFFATITDDIANLTDYIIIDRSDKDFSESLRESGCHVLVNELWDEEDSVPQSLIDTIFSVANIETDVEDEDEGQKASKSKDEKKKDPKTVTVDVAEEDPDKDELKPSSKMISQLSESPEEAGLKEEIEKSADISVDIVEDHQDDEKQEEGDDVQPQSSEVEKTTKKLAEPPEKDEAKESSFEKQDEEEWIDAVNRGIELSFKEENADALSWLEEQSKIDSDNEVQISQGVISEWINSKSNPKRRKGAEIVSILSKNRRDTYLQILQKEMISAVTDNHEDLRRKLIQVFSILNETDTQLAESLTRGLTRELILLKEIENVVVAEKSKLTTLQLVILSRRLTRVCTIELLQILEKNISTNTNTNIWNILTAFDAGTVALELVTNFSLTTVNEILSRGNILRFTGGVIETFNAVIEAWKSGDKAAISKATGSILPEVTLRKFERLELARKVQKLKMVQLTALAESVGKDVETVERLITELIMNDELQAEMKLIEDKMYLVAEETANNNANGSN